MKGSRRQARAVETKRRNKMPTIPEINQDIEAAKSKLSDSKAALRRSPPNKQLALTRITEAEGRLLEAKNGIIELIGPVTPPVPPTDPIPPIPPPVIAIPGSAGTPQFAVVPNGVRAFWGAGAGGIPTGYKRTGEGLAGETTNTGEILPYKTLTEAEEILPAGFTGWYCVRPTNSAGDALEQSCNSYTGVVTPPIPPVPVPPPGGSAPDFVEDFSSYGSTSELITG